MILETRLDPRPPFVPVTRIVPSVVAIFRDALRVLAVMNTLRLEGGT